MKTGLDSYESVNPSFAIMLFFVLGPLFPRLFSMLPNKMHEKQLHFTRNVREIAVDVLRSEKAVENDEAVGEANQSIIEAFSEICSLILWLSHLDAGLTIYEHLHS